MLLAIYNQLFGLFLKMNETKDECSMMVCRAGRECQLNSNGEASCVCMASCPDHFVPVCGSNGRSYDNYCMMHRDACLSGVHISLKSKGYCSDEKTSALDKEETFFEPGNKKNTVQKMKKILIF